MQATATPPDTVVVIQSWASSLANALVIGIVSGLVTAILVFLAARWWNRGLVPWFEARVYHGMNVSGVWELRNTPGADGEKPLLDNEVLTLHQNAQRLRGTLTLIAPESPAASRVRTVVGDIQDRMVCLTIRSERNTELSYHSLLAEVETDGHVLSGKAVFYDLISKAIVAEDVVYEKKS